MVSLCCFNELNLGIKIRMKIQIIKDGNGSDTGVFIPIEDWEIIKAEYPEIQEEQISVPDWQKEIVLKRVAEIQKNPQILRPVDDFFNDNDNVLNEP